MPVVVTKKFPDLVLIHKETKKVEIFELTSCTDSKERIEASQARKGGGCANESDNEFGRQKI